MGININCPPGYVPDVDGYGCDPIPHQGVNNQSSNHPNNNGHGDANIGYRKSAKHLATPYGQAGNPYNTLEAHGYATGSLPSGVRNYLSNNYGDSVRMDNFVNHLLHPTGSQGQQHGMDVTYDTVSDIGVIVALIDHILFQTAVVSQNDRRQLTQMRNTLNRPNVRPNDVRNVRNRMSAYCSGPNAYQCGPSMTSMGNDCPPGMMMQNGVCVEMNGGYRKRSAKSYHYGGGMSGGNGRSGGGMNNPIIETDLYATQGSGWVYQQSGQPYVGPYHRHQNGEYMIGSGTMGVNHEVKANEIIVRQIRRRRRRR